RRRLDRERHLAADHLGVYVIEAEERAGVIRLQDDQVASLSGLSAAMQLGRYRRIAPDFAAQREGPDYPAAPRELQVDATHRLAIVARNRTELQVHIELDILQLAFAVFLAGARDRRFEEAAAVEPLAAHGHLDDAVRAPFGPQRSLIAFSRRIGREVRVQEVTVPVDLQRSLDRNAPALDDDVLESRRLRFRHHVERGLARLPGNLDPAGQDIVQLELGEIGLNPHLALITDLADKLDRNAARDLRSEVEPEPRAACVVQRRLQADISIAVGGLAIIECGLLSVDLDVALDLIALIVGDDLERIGLELLVHHQLVG